MPQAEHVYVSTLARVRQALTSLVDLNVHPSVAGYLCVLNAASQARRQVDLRPDFKGFFDRFFQIGDAPHKKPYAVPFAKNTKTILFNANVAGSYAPSSIRSVSPLHSLMGIKGGGRAVFSLEREHARIAREVLLPKPLPLYAFATFFYRDFGFAGVPNQEVLESAVAADFGYAIQDRLYESQLFSNDFSSWSVSDFEPFEAAT